MKKYLAEAAPWGPDFTPIPYILYMNNIHTSQTFPNPCEFAKKINQTTGTTISAIPRGSK